MIKDSRARIAARKTNLLVVLSVVPLVAFMAGCASGPVKLADKDTTGQFDGAWVAKVGGPLAKREELPGNWFMSCEWEPYTLTFLVSNGMIERIGDEETTPVSADGEFRLQVKSGGASVIGGVAASERVDRYYSGTLDNSGGDGRYMVTQPAIGSSGCRANIEFDRTSA